MRFKKTKEDRVFALKILRKVDGASSVGVQWLSWQANGNALVIRLKQVEHVINERNVLADVAGHPFITTLVTTFRDSDSLYMLVWP